MVNIAFGVVKRIIIKGRDKSAHICGYIPAYIITNLIVVAYSALGYS